MLPPSSMEGRQSLAPCCCFLIVARSIARSERQYYHMPVSISRVHGGTPSRIKSKAISYLQPGEGTAARREHREKETIFSCNLQEPPVAFHEEGPQTKIGVKRLGIFFRIGTRRPGKGEPELRIVEIP